MLRWRLTFLLPPLVLLAALLGGCDRSPAETSASPPKFHGTEVRAPQFGRDFRLRDSEGQERTLADWRGKAVLLFFGYTQCPDVCPTALSRAARVMQLLGPDAGQVQVLFVTLDPERDTPALLKEYVPAFHPSFIGLYADTEATAQLANEFRVFYKKNPGSTPSTYTIDHSVSSYAYDPAGQLRLVIAHDASAQDVAEDLRALLPLQPNR